MSRSKRDLPLFSVIGREQDILSGRLDLVVVVIEPELVRIDEYLGLIGHNVCEQEVIGLGVLNDVRSVVLS